jgi:TniQ
MSRATFAAWESTWPRLPARTRLFNLEPIGLGTPYVESLTSYISRLAAEHHVAPWVLVSRDIAPRMSRKTLGEPNGHTDLYAATSASLNGVCASAAEAVAAMEELTGRSDVSELTMLRYRHVLPPNGLVSRYQAWCPVCLEEWQVKGKRIYEPLFWAMKDTAVCPDHFVPLHSQCPKCGKLHSPLTWYSKPGHCPRCKSWLGYNAFVDFYNKPDPFASIAEWRSFKSLGVGHLLGIRPEQIAASGIGNFSRNIRVLRDHLFKGNVSEMSRAVQHSSFTVNEWAAGHQMPQLLSVLFLAYRLNLLPQELLCSALDPGQPFELRECPFEVTKHVRRRKRKRDQEGLRNYLQLTLDANISPPPSFRHVCIRAQIDQGHAAKSFPDLARAIMDRYQRYVKGRTAERRGTILAALRQAIAVVQGRGEFPSMRRVQRELKDPCWMREKWVRGEWKRIAEEMGLIQSRDGKRSEH